MAKTHSLAVSGPASKASNARCLERCDPQRYAWFCPFQAYPADGTFPPRPDGVLVAEIKAVITEMPTYGYRRVWTVLRQNAQTKGRPSPNHKQRDNGEKVRIAFALDWVDIRA